MGTEGGEAAEEAEWVAALRSGDEASYVALMQRFGPRLLSLARSILGNEAEAQDCVQEAFIQAFKKVGGFEGRSPLWPWVRRIAVNACLGRIRARHRQAEATLEAWQPEFDADGCRLGLEPRQLPAADELLASDRVRAAVRAAVRALPEIHRTVLILRDFEELSTGEVAELLGLEPGAIRVRLHRARAALKKQLEPAFGGKGM